MGALRTLFIVVLSVSLIGNGLLLWDRSSLMKTVMESRQAAQVIEQNYYGLWNRINNHFNKPDDSFLGRFRKQLSQDINMESWKDPHLKHDDIDYTTEEDLPKIVIEQENPIL